MLEENDYLVGHVSTGHAGASMHWPWQEGSYRQISEHSVLYLQREDGSKGLGVQWMFKKSILESLEEVVGRLGTSYVDIEVPPQKEADDCNSVKGGENKSVHFLWKVYCASNKDLVAGIGAPFDVDDAACEGLLLHLIE